MLIALLLAAAPVCPPMKWPAARFPPGEVLSFRLDVLGADVGTFEVRSEIPSDKRAALEISSRAHTSAFVSTNVGRYDAYATVLVASDFSPLHYREDVDEGEVHRAVEVEFPPGANGALALKATRNGEPEPLAAQAGPDARDVLSGFYLFRAQAMKTGANFCMEVFAGRKMWKVTARVAARETIDTPLGKQGSLRIDAESVLTADARIKRTAHLWVSDDERRLPLAAIGEMRGKVIRATLTSFSGTRRGRN